MTVVVIGYVRYAMQAAKREAELDREWATRESEKLKSRSSTRSRRLE